MRNLLLGVFLIVISQLAGAVPFEELLYKGRVNAFYGNASNPRQQQLLDSLKGSRFAERMAQLTDGVVRLHNNIGVGFVSCGSANAYFDPQRSAVVICLEMVELMAKLARSDTEGVMKMDRADFSRTIDGALWGIFFHELGHAIIGVNRVPITGREEDVADQFALYFATNFVEPRNVPVVQPTIWLFKQMSLQQDVASADQDTIKRLMSNEHSLDQQRIYNLACWAYGANPAKGAVSAQYVGLPEDRARRCGGEYATLHRGVSKQFQKYLKIQPQ